MVAKLMECAVAVPLQRLVRHLKLYMRASRLLHPQTQEDRNARLLYLNTAMLGVPFGGIVAFMPVFMARLGASETLIGWMTSAPSLLSIFLVIPGAAIAERYADQVKVRVTGSRIFRLSYLLCAIVPFFVSPEALPFVLVGIWTLKTLPDVVAMPAWTTVLSQAVTPKRRATLNSTRWALLSIVSAGTSALFGWLLDVMVFPGNYQLVFAISFLIAWLDPLFFSYIKVPPIEITRLSSERNIVRRYREYLAPIPRAKTFLTIMAATVLYRIALNLPAPLLSVFWVKDLQASDTLIGLRGTVGHAALVVGYVIWGRSAGRLGHRWILALSAWGLALYPVLTAMSPSAIWLLPVAALWGLTVAGIDVGLFDMMLAAIPRQRQPLFSAIWHMMANAAMFAGPLIGASISKATTTGTALIIAGVPQLVATVPFMFLPRDV